MNFLTGYKNKSIALTACVAASVLIILYGFVYRINNQKAADMQYKIKEADSTNRLISDISDLQAKLDAYADMRSDSQDSAWTLSKVSQIANACGITIDSAEPLAALYDGEFVFLPCKIVFQTPYDNFKEFIKRVESEKKFLRVNELLASAIKAYGTKNTQSQSPSQEPHGQAMSFQMVKKSEKSGIWIKVEMEVSAFYFK